MLQPLQSLQGSMGTPSTGRGDRPEGRARAADKRVAEFAKDMEAMEESHEAEVARLQGELREAKGREEALQSVVAQWMGAHGHAGVGTGA